ncbi:MAG: thioredoxin family protein [Sedimentisphaerales bacterium]|nr:thioredoxin family protein [Sedimentisphaerales bacterium]
MVDEDKTQDQVPPSDTKETSSCSTCSTCSCGSSPWHWLFVAMLVVVVIIIFNKRFNSHSEPDTPAIVWNSDYQAGIDQAKSQNKPILIAFHASWCPKCREMKQVTYHDPEVIRTADNFIRIMIDVDKQGDIAKKYNINPIPAYVILDSNGVAIDTFIGYHPPDEFIARLRAAL